MERVPPGLTSEGVREAIAGLPNAEVWLQARVLHESPQETAILYVATDAKGWPLVAADDRPVKLEATARGHADVLSGQRFRVR